MRYTEAREIVESALDAILNEVLVDDPVTPGKGKAPPISLPKKPTTAPTDPRKNPRDPRFDPSIYYPLNDPRNPNWTGPGPTAKTAPKTSV